MATSRPLREGDRLVSISESLYLGDTYIYSSDLVRRLRNRLINALFVLAADFHLPNRSVHAWWDIVGERVFGVPDCFSSTDPRLAAAITNGTAPGLYVREGDDTSDWETYRQVLARRVEEAMAARRGGAGVGETTTVTAAETTTRQDDEIRVGDVVEVVSCRSTGWTTVADVGTRGRVTEIDESVGTVHLESYRGQRLPQEGIAGLADVRKVSSPSPQNTTASVSPMSDQEAARIATTVADEVRRRIASPLVSSSDETTRQRVVNSVPPAPAVDVRLQFSGERETTASRIRQAVQRELDRLYGRIDAPPQPQPQPQPPSPPSRFSLLEVDADVKDTTQALAPQAPKASAGLAALQQELRAEREAKRAPAAAQMPPGRFDLLECDLPAAPAPAAAKPVKSPQSPRPVVSSSPPPRPRNPVETITDLTAARSPLELARMLEGLNDELSTMMRQREVN